MSYIYRLLRPIDYLRIKHPQKLFYDLTLPLVLSVVGTFILILLPKPFLVFGEAGLISTVTGILQILTGFYIASLAAVATFDKQGMDEPLKGDPIELYVTRKGKKIKETVTRRRFLSLLFGYLALLSFFLYFIGAGANLLMDNIKYILPAPSHCYVKWSFVAIYLFLTANLITTTLHGLYYMVDRIHRIDPHLVGDQKKP